MKRITGLVSVVKFVLLLLAVISACELRAQNLQWQTIFGNPGEWYNDQAYNCIQSADGSFLATGRWEIPIPEWPYTRVKAFVSRLDSSGNVLWTKLIGDSTESNEAFSLAEDSQGNIYLAYRDGYANLAKLNANGDLIWDSTYSSYNILSFRGISFQDNFRNIVLLGLNYGVQFDWTASVTKLDSSGRLIWNRPIYDSIPSIRTYSIYDNSFCFTESGYYVCGSQGDIPYILKLDTSGRIIWNNRYMIGRAIKSIEKISDLSLMASCALLPGLCLLKIDSSGIQYWSRDYSSDSLAGFIYSDKILRIPNHKFAFGVTRGNYFGRLMITDTSGNILESKFYKFSNSYTIDQENINYCNDSGYVICGSVRYWNSINEHSNVNPGLNIKDLDGDKNIDILIYKTTKTGNTTFITTQSTLVVESMQVLVSPNPSNGRFRVNISSDSRALIGLKLFDIAGRLVYSETLPMNSQNEELYINTDNLTTGIYFLRTEMGNDLRINKVLILK